MMERAKSVLLALLIAVSLVQSYFLAYSMPSMEAKVRTEQDYVKTDPLGPEEQVGKLLLPEQLVLHLGADKHTVFYPNDSFYDLVLGKLQGREFKGFQQDTIDSVDWEQVRKEDIGVEVRFGRAVPFELLEQVFKIDSNFLFSADSVSRIWIFASKDREEVRTFFFSADGRNVYEALRADLTVQDVQQCVGFGQYWTPFAHLDGGVYVPEKTRPYDAVQVPFSRYTPDQIQRNLFIDPGTTRMIQDRQDGTRIYTDGKRGLKIEQDSGWLSYTDLVAPTDSQNDLSDNISAAVKFVNQHGGWNGTHRLVSGEGSVNDSGIRFQQYYKGLPILSGGSFKFGYMQLTIQQGVVTSYERSMIVLDEKSKTSATQVKLPAGESLRAMIRRTAGGSVVESVFPAYQATLTKDAVKLQPVWAIRLTDGEVRKVE
ncbi:YycH family regulatory protein [Cohnella thermotolerans]|uniref:YycH family regulatory protein n=1 Tax=Cohnella thermotolerans TaxID=329858 RepID=UPI00047C96DD|nr:two-component system activity regulator YycH [Cohnella thermotolerans]